MVQQFGQPPRTHLEKLNTLYMWYSPIRVSTINLSILGKNMAPRIEIFMLKLVYTSFFRLTGIRRWSETGIFKLQSYNPPPPPPPPPPIFKTLSKQREIMKHENFNSRD
jgi:hypothetical protein